MVSFLIIRGVERAVKREGRKSDLSTTVNRWTISDDMQMGAIVQYSGDEQVVLLAHRGGRGRARNCESTAVRS